MSSSLASAKRRRAGIQSSTPTPSQIQQPQQPQQPQQTQQPVSVNQRARMSLPQLINSMEARIKALESNKPVDDVSNKEETKQELSFDVTNPNTGEIKKMTLGDYMTDMDNKFFMLAEEITNMKEIVMKLQSFTMEVNKVLHEERVRILSEMPEKVIIAEDNITEDNIDENLKTTENINMDATM
jgi:hypothetical protein